VSKTDFSGVV